MSRVLTGDKLIDSVRKRTMTPDDTTIYTDQDILDIVNEELDVEVLENLLALHEEHLTTHIDVPRNADGVYEIPYRAIGNKLRDVSLKSGSEVVYELTQVSLGELPDYSYSVDSNAYLDKFYVESNKIKLLQPNRNYDSIRFYFYIRPSVLTKVEQAGIISSIVKDENADEITISMSSLGRNFSANCCYDIVGKRTPNKIKAWDLDPIQYVTTGTTGYVKFTLSELGDDVDDIIVGDYVTIAEQSPVPNIPTEMHPVLAQAGAIQLLEALGDTEGLTNAQRRLDKMTKAVQSLVDDRVELAPKKIKPRHSTLSQALGSSKKYRGRY
jgi:hypothetical protein